LDFCRQSHDQHGLWESLITGDSFPVCKIRLNQSLISIFWRSCECVELYFHTHLRRHSHDTVHMNLFTLFLICSVTLDCKAGYTVRHLCVGWWHMCVS
jgi:hypothetical protein